MGEFEKNASQFGDDTLLIKAAGSAWFFVVIYQDIMFGLLQGVLSGQPAEESFTAGELSYVMLPSIVRLPVELLLLCVFTGMIGIFSDGSLLKVAESQVGGFLGSIGSDSDSRTNAKTLEEFELLNDEQITRQRAWLTFGYHFLNVGYLSIEALSMQSLYTSMATLVIGYYIMFKGMQRKIA